LWLRLSMILLCLFVSIALAARGADAEVTVQQFGAKGDGVTDDSKAFQDALSSHAAHAAAVFAPSAKYRLSSGLVIPPGKTLYGEGFIPSSSAVPAGTTLVFGPDVQTCLMLNGNSWALAASAHDLIITRAKGAVPESSIGVLTQNGYNPQLYNVLSMRQAVGFYFLADALGISCSPTGIFTSQITDAHVVVDSWPELRCIQSRFGSNGPYDVPCNAYVRLTGGGAGGSGPNGISFVNCQFNQGESAGNVVGAFLDFRSLGPSQGYNVGQFDFTNCHIENAAVVVSTDSSVSILDRLALTSDVFQDNPGTGTFFSLSGATALNNFRMANCALTTNTFSLAPSQQINSFLVSNTVFGGNCSITGVGNSTVSFQGCAYQNGLKIAGSFGRAIFSGVLSGGNVINTATSPVQIDIPGASMTPGPAPGITFGGRNTGVTYTLRQSQWKMTGNIITYEFEIALSDKGTSTGYAQLTGLPFQPNGYYAPAGGGAVVYATSMNGLTGPLLMSVAPGTTSANIYQYGPSGIQVVTNANFTNGSVIYGTIEYPW